VIGVGCITQPLRSPGLTDNTVVHPFLILADRWSIEDSCYYVMVVPIFFLLFKLVVLNWFALDVCTPKLVKGVKEIIGEHVGVMNAAMKEWTQIM
jgi:hypothetical protein